MLPRLFLLLAVLLTAPYLHPSQPIGASYDDGSISVRPKATFGLQLFYERPADEQFAKEEAAKLLSLLRSIAPHIRLDVVVQLAPAPQQRQLTIADGQTYTVTQQAPTMRGYTSLLLSNEQFGAQGIAGYPQGTLNVQLMRQKTRAGGDSADITIHEWLHMIAGQKVGTRTIPDPHANAQHGYARPTRVGPDGQDNWDGWYAWMLR